ncbi:MAG: hypothetical protein LBB88_02655, partial [Planctomycetaceae bacterium]|nr:hypothetical protein [Planctomycetaceae bacterium]
YPLPVIFDGYALNGNKWLSLKIRNYEFKTGERLQQMNNQIKYLYLINKTLKSSIKDAYLAAV